MRTSHFLRDRECNCATLYAESLFSEASFTDGCSSTIGTDKYCVKETIVFYRN